MMRPSIEDMHHVNEPDPTPDVTLECDFCNLPCPAPGSPPTEWVTFRAIPFALAPLSALHVTATFSAEWLTCPECAPHVRAGRWPEVFARHVRRVVDQGFPLDMVPLLAVECQRLWAEFDKARL